MTNKTLLDRLSRLGLPLMKVDDTFDVNEALADVLKSRDPRLWEGFPVVLLNAAKDSNFSYDLVANKLTAAEKKRLHALFLMAFALYAHYHLSASWMNQLKTGLSQNDKDQLKNWRHALSHDSDVELEGMQFHGDRLKKMFELYFEKEAESNRQQKVKNEELTLEYSLSQLFTARQKELLRKKLEGLPLTKTEREYYSRAVKKKVVALANAELHRMAQQLVQR
jgi:hypothetical protein